MTGRSWCSGRESCPDVGADVEPAGEPTGHGNHSRQPSFEVRWVHTGPVPTPVGLWADRRLGPPCQRVDVYLHASADQSVKLRHAGTERARLEVKDLVERRVWRHGAVTGRAERWTKTVHDAGSAHNLDGFALHKRRWRRGGVEIVELSGGTHWSVAVKLHGGAVVDFDELDMLRWADLLCDKYSSSLAQYVAQRAGGPAETFNSKQA
jgi:hypothetical protein